MKDFDKVIDGCLEPEPDRAAKALASIDATMLPDADLSPEALKALKLRLLKDLYGINANTSSLDERIDEIC